MPKVSRTQFYGLLALMVLLATAATRDGGRFLTFWSPYYKVTYHPRNGMIETNHIGHQVIVDVRQGRPGLLAAPLAESGRGRAAVR